MLGLIKRPEAGQGARTSRVVEVGWINRADKASFM